MEEAALKDGEYVGVRRFTRILENGNDAKAITDRLVDICGGLVNLRTAIMRYRKPQDSLRFFRCQMLKLPEQPASAMGELLSN